MQPSSGDNGRARALDGVERACLDDRMNEQTLASAIRLDVPGLPFAARARYLHGNVLYRLNRDDEAIAAFREAEVLAAQENDARTHAMAVLRQCEWAAFHDRWTDVEGRLKCALAGTMATGDAHLRARAEETGSHLAIERRDWDQAKGRLEAAVTLYTEAARTEEAQRCGKRAEQVRYRVLLERQTLDEVQRDAELRGQLDVFAGALLWAGLEALRLPKQATAILDRALALGKLSPADEAEARLGRSVCSSRLAEFSRALEDAAHVARDEAADPRTRNQARANLLSIKLAQGDTLEGQEVVTLFDDELLRAVAVPATVLTARALYDLRRGNLEAALVHLEHCENGPDENFYQRAEIAQLKAYIFLSLGRSRDALQVCIDACESIPDDAGYIGALLQFRLGTLFGHLGEWDDARDAFRDAASALADIAPESALHSLSTVFALRAAWDADAPEEEVQAELEGLLASLAPNGPPTALGCALALRAALTSAPEDALRAAELFITADLPVDAADALDDAAILFASVGRDDEAVEASGRAARLLDDLLALAPDDENRVGVQSRTRYTRVRLVGLLFDTRPRDALREALRAKSGALVHLLRHRLADATPVDVRRVLGTIIAPPIDRTVASIPDADLRAVTLFAVASPPLESIRQLYRELTHQDRVARALNSERDVSIEELVMAVPPHGALLELFPTSDWIYAFVVQNGGVRSTRTPRTDTFDEALDTAARDLRPTGVPGRMGERRLRGALRRLYRGLVGEVATSLAGVDRLWISPSAELAGVPWPALLAPDDSALIDRFELTMLLSGAQLALRSAPRPGTHLCLVRGADGRRPLVAADFEIDRVGEVFGAKGWSVERHGPEAARGGVEVALTRASVFHFAGHAGFDEREGMAAHLATPERPLVAAEILGLDLRNLRLAVLSGCDTGRAEADTGDEFVGLLRAFFAAGCQTVLASRWLVDDASAAWLMLATYERWLVGERLAASLRDAQRRLRDLDASRLRHPFYWANFALYGVE
jgi:CHAT domain-containing protein/tetratricopeptide (TPR) repeat protein